MKKTSKKQKQQQGKSCFVINLFGESGTGKTTVLRNLIEMLRPHTKLGLEVSEHFGGKDCRAIFWYRTGKSKPGAVCVCTQGDSLGIIRQNIDFFESHFSARKAITPWAMWKKLALEGGGNMTTPCPQIGILVTASRKPLGRYKKLLTRLQGYEILNIPISLDVWNNHNSPKGLDWTTSIHTLPELLLLHINYVLHNVSFKRSSIGSLKTVNVSNLHLEASQD